MMLKSARTIVALGLFLFVSTNVVAGTTLFTDEASFVAAIPSGYYLENFSSFAKDANPASPLSMGPVNGFSYDISAAGNLYSGGGNMSSANIVVPIVISFTGAPVYAVGGNFWLTVLDFSTATGSLTIGLADGLATMETLTDAIPTTFRGFVSTMPITSITLTPATEFATLDNLYVAGAPVIAAVPAPGAILLVAVGTSFIGWVRRKNSL